MSAEYKKGACTVHTKPLRLTIFYGNRHVRLSTSNNRQARDISLHSNFIDSMCSSKQKYIFSGVLIVIIIDQISSCFGYEASPQSNTETTA